LLNKEINQSTIKTVNSDNDCTLPITSSTNVERHCIHVSKASEKETQALTMKNSRISKSSETKVGNVKASFPQYHIFPETFQKENAESEKY
jgi:hypothetical protein